ncbi:response regulator [Aliarcobacter lanthieri]|uniref:response regulator n=1 Tax=Aliarcobacter lanthieri TaxID=1355374 RepID=UPI003AFB5765
MNKEKILIVEDESIVAFEIKKMLDKLNFEITDIASDYESAINSAITNKPDLILVDISLGKNKDGIDLVKKIQTFYDDIPIIYLTGFCEEDIINRAIRTKPVSYLIKPFKMEELKLNIILGLHKNIKKIQNFANKDIIFLGEDYWFCRKENLLYFKSVCINLGLKERKLLKILLDAKGNIVEFKELEELIWGNNNISNSTLRTLVYRLRVKLNYKFIETIPNAGCRII